MTELHSDHCERVERRLWTIDLNDVRVIDQHGNALEVTSTVGTLNGPLTVHVALDEERVK